MIGQSLVAEKEEGMTNEERIESLTDAVYGGARWNPGEGKRVMVLRKRANVFDINVCEQSGCKCRWNIKIGSEDYKLLYQILDLVDGN